MGNGPERRASKSPPVVLVSVIPNHAQHHHHQQQPPRSSIIAHRSSRFVPLAHHQLRHVAPGNNNNNSSSTSNSNSNNSSSGGSGSYINSSYGISKGTSGGGGNAPSEAGTLLVGPGGVSPHYGPVQLMGGPPPSGVSEEAATRSVKFVAAANTFSHIPSASVHHHFTQPARVSGQTQAAATLVNKRGYATYPMPRSHHHHHPLQQQSPHSPSLAYVKDAASSFTIRNSGASTAGGGGHMAGRNGPVYYNYTAAIGGRGQQFEFKDRNGFVHNTVSYMTTAGVPATGPKRSWAGPGPRFEAKAINGGDGGGGGGGGRDWPPGPQRQQYAIVSTTMAP